MTKTISIHAPLAGSDDALGVDAKAKIVFQSTLPSRGATEFTKRWETAMSISIHAPLAGSDLVGKLAGPQIRTISIHAPLAGSDGKNTQKALKRIERNAQSFIFVFPSRAIGFFPPPFFSRKFLQNYL